MSTVMAKILETYDFQNWRFSIVLLKTCSEKSLKIYEKIQRRCFAVIFVDFYRKGLLHKGHLFYYLKVQ